MVSAKDIENIKIEAVKPPILNLPKSEVEKVDFLYPKMSKDFLVPVSGQTKKVLPKKKQVKIKKSIKVDTKQNYTASQEEVIQTIKYYSTVYGLDEVRVLRIAKCESTYNSNAKSRTGKYKGIFQWDNSFYGWAKKLGIENADPFNPEHNTRAATLAMSYDLWSKWECK